MLDSRVLLETQQDYYQPNSFPFFPHHPQFFGFLSLILFSHSHTVAGITLLAESLSRKERLE